MFAVRLVCGTMTAMLRLGVAAIRWLIPRRCLGVEVKE